jgi:hypothetical protein
METIHHLTQLLKNSGCDYRVFDLGRRINEIEPSTFSHIEQGKQPYPYPLQRTAHLAIAYWNADRQPWIWFLKFELDERGLLKQADIGRFIQYVLEAMGSRLNQQLSEEQQNKLANNPYTFKPKDDKMAVFHSQIRSALTLPSSQYYEHAQLYFRGGLGWDNWQTIGLQGISDLCCRLGQEHNSETLLKALTKLPSQPLYALLGVLEHIALPEKLALKIATMAKNEIKCPTPDLFLLSALVRALAGSKKSTLTDVINLVLSSSTLSHQEVLIGIAGRCWPALTESTIAEQFLLRLAQTNNQSLFNQVFADLVMIPQIRMTLLPLLHSTPSKELANALQLLQLSTKGNG